MNFTYLYCSLVSLENFFSNLKIQDKKNMEKIRVDAFKIEAFSKVIKTSTKKSQRKHSKYLKHLHQQAKAINKSAKFIEDGLGAYLSHLEMSSLLKDKTRLKNAKSKFLANKKIYLKYIQTMNKNSSLFDAKNIKKLYLKGLNLEIKDTEKKLPTIDSLLLEDGTHELRRALRWIIMYFIYPHDLFKYYESRAAVNEYTQLNTQKADGLIKIHFNSINTLSKAVSELGDAKDKGLALQYKNNSKDINQSTEDIISETEYVLGYVQALNPLKNLRKDLQKS